MHLRQYGALLGLLLLAGVVSGWTYEEEEEYDSLSLFNSGDDSIPWKPRSPDTWICYGTAGSESLSILSVNSELLLATRYPT